MGPLRLSQRQHHWFSGPESACSSDWTGHQPIVRNNLTLAGANEDFGATGDLDIRDDLTIKGAGALGGETIIDAAGLDRVFQVFGAKATFADVVITGGVASQGGG